MLRNIGEILNYHLFARDGEIGICKDFLFDDDQWAIRYMVADTRKWLPGRKVLISPLSLGSPQKKETIEKSPEYHPNQPVNLAYEARLYDYYGRPVA